MGTWFHEVSIDGRECLLVLPGLDYAVRPRIGRSFRTDIGEGRTGIETRVNNHNVGRLQVSYTYTFSKDDSAIAADMHATLLALGNKRLALPIECDRLPAADYTDALRIFTAQHTINYNAASGSYDFDDDIDDSHPETAGLVVCSLMERPTFRLFNDFEYRVTIRAEEDSPWGTRVAVNTLALAAWTFEPDFARPVEDLSKWQQKRDQIGRGREQSRSGDDAPAKRGERATFTFSERNELRQALTFFETQRGQQGAFTVPKFLRPEWDEVDGNAPVMQARFGTDVFWMDFANQDQARANLIFWQVLILDEGEPDQAHAPRCPAVKLWWQGSTTVYAWADWESPITIGADDYESRPFDVAVPVENLRPGTSDWEILVRDFVGCPLRAFSLNNINRKLNIEIREFEPSDPDGTAAVRMIGTINRAPRTDKIFRATAVLMGGRLKTLVPDATVKTTCNCTVYDANCKLDPADFTDTGLITAIAGLTIDVDVGEANADDWYSSGYAVFGTGDDIEVRIVIRSESIIGGTRLTVLRPLVTNIVGAAAAATAGCDSQFMGGCADLDNQLNFYGAPHKPPYIEAVQSGIKTRIGK